MCIFSSVDAIYSSVSSVLFFLLFSPSSSWKNMYLGWDSLCDSWRSYFLLVGSRERDKKWGRSSSNVAFQITSIVVGETDASSSDPLAFILLSKRLILETFPHDCAFISIAEDIIVTVNIPPSSSPPSLLCRFEWTGTDHHAVGVHDTHPAAIFWAGHRRKPSLPPSPLPPTLPCPANDLVC